jgi:ABC-type Fe3+-citrate transport system substrate-binding protein
MLISTSNRFCFSFIQIVLLIMLSFPFLIRAEPIAIKTENDTVLLPKVPSRIIVLEFSLLDDLLQLGVKPIGLASSRIDEGTNPPFLLAQINGIPDVGTRQQPNLEKILSLHPDLIVADLTMQSEIYPLFKQIAPTLLLNGLQGDLETQIHNLQTLAKITATFEKVQPLETQLREKYAHAKKLNANSRTVIIGYISSSGQFQALTSNALTSKILLDLGFRNLITISRKEQSSPLPMETLLALNPDTLIILFTDHDKEPYHSLSKNPLWKELTAYKTKHIYFMDRDIWAKNHGILATELLLKEAEDSGFLAQQPNYIQ